MNEIMNIGGVECYEKNGTAYLKLEAVAYGLDITKTDKKGSVEYKRINNQALKKWLHNFGILNSETDILPDFIPESAFYRLAMKAKNEVAEKFQAKVADEIIPSIRKHGAYMTPQTLEQALTSPDFLIQLATKLKEEQQARKAAEAQIEADKPKVMFADAVTASDTSILIRDYAKILRQNGIETGERRLYAWFRQNGYIIKNSTQPTQKAMELGLFEVVERSIQRGEGLPRVTSTTRVTGKGQVYFLERIKKVLDKAV